MASQHVIELNESNWGEHVGGEGLVVVDFWAPWCPPCRSMGPIIDSLADRYAGKVKFCKLNVDDNPNISTKYNINAIPQFLFFKGSDKPMHVKVGSTSEEELAQLVDKYM
jgi:thioredoxin 1